MRILLVEDDAVLGDGLRAGLELGGHAVDWLVDGASATNALEGERFSAAILDLQLPRASGLEVLRAWRRRGRDLAVLVLTAHGSDDGCIEALDDGADDYLVKPIDLDVLEARLRAVVRRVAGRAGNRARCGALTVEPDRRLALVDGEPVGLSAYEFRVLEALIERPGGVVGAERLESVLYGWGEGPQSNSVRVIVHKLRRKIGARRIETVRGLGYRLVG